jgi:hypothetical protein
LMRILRSRCRLGLWWGLVLRVRRSRVLARDRRRRGILALGWRRLGGVGLGLWLWLWLWLVGRGPVPLERLRL